MTVLMTEGFDMYNGTGGQIGLQALWSITGSPAVFSLTGGRFGGQSLQMAGQNGFAPNPSWIRRLINGAGTTTSLSLGMAVYFANGIDSNRGIEFCNTGFGVQCGVGFNSNQSAYIYSGAGGTTYAVTSAGVIPVNSWNYWEVELVVHSSAGTMNLYMNGSLLLSLTGLNTAAAGGGIGYLQFYIPISTASSWVRIIDDIYVTDSATKLGESRIETLRPASDNTAAWTPSSGANNYSRVNETTVDGDTSYVQTATIGAQDLYTIGSLSSTPASIWSVNVVSFAEKTDATTRLLYNTVKSGSTSSDGSSVNLSASYTRYDRVLSTDPATSAAWTASGVNNLLIGPKVG